MMKEKRRTRRRRGREGGGGGGGTLVKYPVHLNDITIFRDHLVGLCGVTIRHDHLRLLYTESQISVKGVCWGGGDLL